MEEALINSIVTRIQECLPHNSTDTSQYQEIKLRNYVKALLDVSTLPSVDISAIYAALFPVFESLSKTQSSDFSQTQKISRSKFIILELFYEILQLTLPHSQRNLALPPRVRASVLYDNMFIDTLSSSQEEKQIEDEEVDDDEEYMETAVKASPDVPTSSPSSASPSSISPPNIVTTSADLIPSSLEMQSIVTSPKKRRPSISPNFSPLPPEEIGASTDSSPRSLWKMVSRKALSKPGQDSRKELDDTHAKSLFELVAKIVPSGSKTPVAVSSFNPMSPFRSSVAVFASSAASASSTSSTSAVATTTDYYQEQVSFFAKKIIFALSCSNPQLVSSFCLGIFTEGGDLSKTSILEYVCASKSLLTDMFKTIISNIKHFFKVISASNGADLPFLIRSMIWSWISSNTNAFIELYKTEQYIAGLMELFEILYGWAKKREQKALIWPLLSTLMILLPDKCKTAITTKGIDSYSLFLKDLQKILLDTKSSKEKLLFNAALHCTVDFFNASFDYVPFFMTDSGVHLIKNSFENHIIPIIQKSEADITDMNLFSELLKVCYKIDSNNAQSIFALDKGGPSGGYKNVSSRALFSLLESSKEQMQEVIASKFCSSIHNLFKEQFELFVSKTGGESKSSRFSSVALPRPSHSPIDILCTILRIFNNFTNEFFFERVQEATLDKSTEGNILRIVRILFETESYSVKTLCCKVIRKLFMSSRIPLWTSKDPVVGFTETATSVIERLRIGMLDVEATSETTRVLLPLIRSITYRMKRYYKESLANMNNSIATDPNRLSALEYLSSSLLVFLCAVEKEVWVEATRSLKNICDQLDLFQNQNIASLNYSWFRQLSDVDIKTGEMNTERRYQIKILRSSETQTQSTVTIFKHIHSRWKALLRKNTEKTLLSNYTNLLCALAGCLLYHDASTQSITATSTGIASIVKNDHTKFLEDLAQELTNERTGRMISIAVSNNLAPALYDRFVAMLILKSKEIIGEIGQMKYSTTGNLFAESATQIAQFILDGKVSDVSIVTNIDTLVLILINYGSILPFTIECMQLRCKMCYCCESLIRMIGYIAVKNDIELYSLITKNILEWTSDFATKTQVQIDSDAHTFLYDMDFCVLKVLPSVLAHYKLPNEKEEEFVKIFSFLNKYLQRYICIPQQQQMILKSLQGLLQNNLHMALHYYINMAFESEDHIRSSYVQVVTQALNAGIISNQYQESTLAGEATEERTAVPEEKYARLNKFIFDYDLQALLVLLNSVKATEKDAVCESAVVLTQQKGDSELEQLLKFSVQQEVESTIKPETLFRANSTASKLMTRYCNRVAGPYLKLALGDVCAEMFSNAVNFEIDPQKAEKRGEDLEANIEKVKAITQRFVDAIVSSFDKIPPIFRKYCHMLYEEVGKKFGSSQQYEDQFDYDLIAVGGFFFLRLLCPAIVAPHFNSLYHEPPSLDASRAAVVVTKLLQNLANGISTSNKEVMMVPFREFLAKNIPVIRQFFEKLATKPEEETAEPTHIDIRDEEIEEALQTIHYYFYNNIDSLRPSLQSLTRVAPKTEKEELEELLQEYDSDDELMENRTPPKESKFLGEMGDDVSTNVVSNHIISAVEELDNILQALGKPDTVQVKKRIRRSTIRVQEDEFTSILLNDFMNKISSTDQLESKLQAIGKQQAFYAHGATKRGSTLFYFIPNRFTNNDLMIYHIITVLQKHWKKDYALVVDCTNVTSLTSLPIATLFKLVRILPKGPKKNLKHIYIFNPNLVFKTFARSFLSVLNFKSTSFKKRLTLCVGMAELGKNIPSESLKLPEETTRIEKDLQVKFTSVQTLERKVISQDAIILVYKDYIQVISLKHMILGMETNLTWFIPLAGVYEVKEPTEFYVKKNTFKLKCLIAGKEDGSHNSYYFKSVHREQILLAIRSAITRKQQAGELASMRYNKTITSKPSEFIGELLNISFNCCVSRFADIRLAGWNLICSLVRNFNVLDRSTQASTSQFFESQALSSIPRNSLESITEISATVAKNKSDVTLEFLLAALKGLPHVHDKYQLLCSFEYIEPWIANLASVAIEESNNEGVEKFKQIIVLLATYGHQFVDLFTILASIWKQLAAIPQVSKFVVKELIQFAYMMADNAESLKYISDVLVSMSKHEGKFISQHLTTTTIELIYSSIKFESAIDFKSTQVPWTKIIINIQLLLSLSFQDRIHAMDNAPHLLHIIALLAGIGNQSFRALIYSLCCNLIHSLIIAENRNHAPELAEALNELKSKKMSTFFLGKKHDPAFDVMDMRYVAPGEQVQPEIAVTKYHKLLHMLKRVVSIIQPKYVERWEAVAKEALTMTQGILLARSLLVYGMTTSLGHSLDTISLLLRELSKQAKSNMENKRTCVAILLSLDNSLKRLFLEQKNITKSQLSLLYHILLLGIFLLPFNDQILFRTVVDMIGNVLGILHNQINAFPVQTMEYDSTLSQLIGKPKYYSIADTLVSFWKEEAGSHLSKFESLTQLSVHNNLFFSFTLAVLLMKGVCQKKTRIATTNLLKLLYSMSLKLQYPLQASLGYLCPIIPFEKQFQSPAFMQLLFKEENFEKDGLLFLFNSYLLSIIPELFEIDKKMLIYTVILVGFDKMTQKFEECFSGNYSSLEQIIKSFSNMNTSEQMIESSLNLAKLIMRQKKTATSGSASTTTLQEQPENLSEASSSKFSQIGFNGFSDFLTFEKAKLNPEISLLVSDFIDTALLSKLQFQTNS